MLFNHIMRYQMKIFMLLLLGSATILYGQQTPRSGVYGSTTFKSNHGMTFQSSKNTVHLSSQMGYGSGFFIPTQSTVTSVAANETKIETVKTYPNPTNSTVTLEFSSSVTKIRIFDIKGILVYQFDGETSKLTHDVNNFSSGLYRVVAFGRGESYVSTFFVSK